MQKLSFQETLDQIVAEDSRFDKDAYLFIREALDHTIKSLKKERSKQETRHVSGRELLDGIRQFALKEYGPMTVTVLGSWGVKRCEDFGEIVFNLVEKGILGKTEQDRREDFQNGYSFEEAFVLPFKPSAPSPAGPPTGRQNQPRQASPRGVKKSSASQ